MQSALFAGKASQQGVPGVYSTFQTRITSIAIIVASPGDQWIGSKKYQV